MTGSSYTRFCAIILAAWARLVLGKQNANWPDITCSTVRASLSAVGIARNYRWAPPVILPAADCNGGVTGMEAEPRYMSRSWPRTSPSRRRLTEVAKAKVLSGLQQPQ